MEHSASDPVGERRAIEANALALVNLRLAVERLATSTRATVDSVGRPPSISRPRGRRLDDDVLAGAAGVFGPTHDQHPELRRHDVELFADVLANLVKIDMRRSPRSPRLSPPRVPRKMSKQRLRLDERRCRMCAKSGGRVYAP
jgi:hypothetical protein